ncbi:uncharacterized protein TrAtP1_007580 [Trichoderma atroviride]|uniref:uncharacterized protein n=1 Tax=Hypocrea atroviridis TaxID=63577 RepID=UPI0033233BC5|nr:hypothetical protein TrAtP1_007580 [Trichoderma atroviride]
MSCSFSGHRGRRRATTRRSPLCEYAASGSGSGSGSASGGVNAFDDGFRIAYEARSSRIGASGGEVVEQEKTVPRWGSDA